ncbi:MAG: hypothetical protein PHV80_04310 [Rugosibacter sp.]|nr:hypothetical protein [Rugosibacter sp.]
MNQYLMFDEVAYFKARATEAIQRALRALMEPDPYWDQVLFNLNLATELARQLDTLAAVDKPDKAAQPGR